MSDSLCGEHGHDQQRSNSARHVITAGHWIFHKNLRLLLLAVDVVAAVVAAAAVVEK